MKENLTRLVRHSLVYGVGGSLSLAGGFILIPLYTHVLSTEEYGILELLNRTGDILMLVMFMGVRQAFIRFYFDRDDDEWHQTVLWSTTAAILASSIAIGLSFLPFRELLADALFKGSAPGTLFVFVMMWLPMEMIVQVGMTHLQIQMKSIKYVTINFVKLILFITSNVILVYAYREGIIGILITNIWIGALFGSAFLASFITWTRLKISFCLIKDLIKFGLPYLPTAFFMFIISNSDRYFLSIYSSLDAIGVYALGYKIGMFGSALVMDAFGKVWAPFLFENYQKAEGPAVIGRVFMLYISVSVGVGLLISVTSPVVIPLISAKSFYGSSRVVPLICLASIFYGMTSLSDAGILIAKKTTYKPIIFGSCSIIAIALNLLLIPKFGIVGAALALVVTFLILFVVNYRVSNKFYTLIIDYKKIGLIFSSGFVVYFSSSYFLSVAGDSAYLKMCSILLVFGYPSVLWFSGFLSEEEKSMVKKLFLKLRPSWLQFVG